MSTVPLAPPRRYADLVELCPGAVWNCFFALAASAFVGRVIGDLAGWFIGSPLVRPDLSAGAFETADNLQVVFKGLIGNACLLAATFWFLPWLMQRPRSTLISIDRQFDWPLWTRSFGVGFVVIALGAVPVLIITGLPTRSLAIGSWLAGLVFGLLDGFVNAAWVSLLLGSAYQVLARPFRNDGIAVMALTVASAVIVTARYAVLFQGHPEFEQASGIIFLTGALDGITILLITRRSGGIEAGIGYLAALACFRFSFAYSPVLSPDPAEALFRLPAGPMSPHTIEHLLIAVAQAVLFYALLFHTPWQLGRRSPLPAS